MAENLAQVPSVKVFALGLSDVATEVKLPNGGRRFSVLFETNPGKLALTGTDAVAIVADHLTIDADRYFSIDVGDNQGDRITGARSVFLAAAIAATTVRVVVETR